MFCGYNAADYARALVHMTKYDSIDNEYVWTNILSQFHKNIQNDHNENEKRKIEVMKITKFTRRPATGLQDLHASIPCHKTNAATEYL